MRTFGQIFLDFIIKTLRSCPGVEQTTCPNIGPHASDCIRRLNHDGECEDAWGYRWEKSRSL